MSTQFESLLEKFLLSNFLAQESVSISQIVDKLPRTCFATKGYLGQDKVVNIMAIFHFMAKWTLGKGVLRSQPGFIYPCYKCKPRASTYTSPKSINFIFLEMIHLVGWEKTQS